MAAKADPTLNKAKCLDGRHRFRLCPPQRLERRYPAGRRFPVADRSSVVGRDKRAAEPSKTPAATRGWGDPRRGARASMEPAQDDAAAPWPGMPGDQSRARRTAAKHSLLTFKP